jgi:multidrug efflux system membrane fusion protein
VERLTAITSPAELKGYGRVLDPTPLAGLVTELATAQAAATASGKELARLQSLQEDNNTSIRALQAAEAAATRDRLLVQSARDRMVLAWGRAVSQRPDLPALVQALTLQERLIARLDLPAGEQISGLAGTARLVGLADETRSTLAELLGPAPATDPQMQGEGLLYLTRDNSLHLAADAAITGYVALSGTLHGVLLPRAAVLRHAGETWVYLQTDETQFRRVAVALTHPTESGWMISEGLKSGDRVVTDGAQLLLSEELKSQLSLGD